MIKELVIKGSTNRPIHIDYSQCPQGSKNAALPVLCATLAFDDAFVIENIPCIDDVKALFSLFRKINLNFIYNDHTFTKNISCLKKIDFPKSFYKTRGGFYLIASLILRWGSIKINGYKIGGCKIGNRPYTHFLKVLESFGYAVDVENDSLLIRRSTQYTGKVIQLNDLGIIASGMALILAAQFKTKTTLNNFGKAPELNDLVQLMKKKGAIIQRHGRSLIVNGSLRHLSQNSYFLRLQDDRMVIATYAVLSLITGGVFVIETKKLKYLTSFLKLLERINCAVKHKRNNTHIMRRKDLYATEVEVADYPGVPTDIQPIVTILLSVGKGTSIIKDNIFPDRVTHVKALKQMGLHITYQQGAITIVGGKSLMGSSVKANDLRCCASLFIAACIAKGVTRIKNWKQVYRGYEYLIPIVSSYRELYIHE